MKKNKNVAFTLIELLAVILILAIILVIAVPKILKTIKDAEYSSCEQNFKLIIKSIDVQKTLNSNLDLSLINETNIADMLNLPTNDVYDFVEFAEVNNKITATIILSNKFKGLVSHGDIENVTVEPIDNDSNITYLNENNEYYVEQFGLTTEPGGCIPVTNATDFNNIRNNLAGDYCLKSDINMSSLVNWIPIGTDATPFTGRLIGNNFYIKNLVSSKTGSNLALFNVVQNAKFSYIKFKDMTMTSNRDTAILVIKMLGNSNEIKHCKIENSNKVISGFGDAYPSEPGDSAGYLTTLIGGVIIDNSYANMSLSSGNEVSPFIALSSGASKIEIYNSKSILNAENAYGNYGGFLSYSQGTAQIIISRSNAALDLKTVDGSGTSGGVIGFVTGSIITIDECWTVNNIKGFNDAIGGIIATNIGSTVSITNSYVKNSNYVIDLDPDSLGDEAGGIFAFSVSAPLNLTNVYVRNSAINGYYYSGGIIANDLSQTVIENVSVSDFSIETLQGESGGIAGSSGNSPITYNNIYVDADIIGNFHAGGLAGYCNSNTTINNAKMYINVSTGKDVTGYDTFGAVCGVLYEALSATNLEVNGKVTSINTAGGIAAEAWYGTITLTDVTMNVDFVGLESVGSILGMTSAEIILNNYEYNGNIKGENKLGGIFGDYYGSTTTINNADINATIEGNDTLGGIVGYCTGSLSLGAVDVTGSIVGTGADYITNGYGGVGSYFGYLTENVTVNSVITSNVKITAPDYAGGFIGVKNINAVITNQNNMRFYGTINSAGSNVSNTFGYIAN